MAGEFEFIDWIRTQQAADERVICPAGDDLAVLKWAGDELLLIGVDQVLDGVHFDSRIHSPGQIGRKAMNRNLSDCAAMACLPAAAVVSMALPLGTSIDYAKQLYLGIKSAGDAFGCPIVGGDTGSWAGKLAISLTIIGRTAGLTPVYRKAVGQLEGVYVSGPLGGSIPGRHMDFVPRIVEARELAATGAVGAMLDLSDGLSRDVGHLCRENAIGIEIDANAVPIHPDVAKLPADRWSPLEHALNDGEDYELLYLATTQFKGGGTRIGRVVPEPGAWLLRDGRREPLMPRGWEHAL